MKMEKTFTLLSFFLLAWITMFPLNSASAQDSCCCSAVESVIVATASGCTCNDTENLAFINVTTKMMKLHSVFGVSLLSIVDSPESHGLENLITNTAEESTSSQSNVDAQSPNYGPNSAESPSKSNAHVQSPNSAGESPSSESNSKAEPNSPAAPAPVEVPDDDRSDAEIWMIIIIMVILLVTRACCKDQQYKA